MRYIILLLTALILATLPAPASAASVQVNTILAADGPLQPGEYLWDTDGAPAGPLQIVVDLSADRLYAYRGGVEIGRTIIIYGEGRHATPTGTFPILQKDRDHWSNLYHAPMPYMLRLTWGGVAIHGSGDVVSTDYATHGCIGVPDEFAARLYALARKGDKVLVTRGWRRDLYAQ